MGSTSALAPIVIRSRALAELPYFDLLIDERQDGGEAGPAVGKPGALGLLEAPRTAKGTRADYIAAMEQMASSCCGEEKVADGQKLLEAGVADFGRNHPAP